MLWWETWPAAYPPIAAATGTGYAAGLDDFGAFMTTFDEREQGFERKFALDQELEFKATAIC